MATYQIYELSARAVMSYAAEQDGVYTFALNRSATEHCKVPGARHDVFVKRKCEQKGPKKVSTFSTRFHVVSNVFPKYQMLTF